MELFTITPRRLRILFHAVFWVLYITVITFFFSDIFNLEKIFVRTTVTAVLNAIIVYFNILYLLPKFFEHRRFVSYFVLFGILMVFITLIRVYADYLLASGGRQEIQDYLFTFTHYAGVVLSIVIIVFITSSFKFIEDFFRHQQIRQEIKTLKLESELKILKGQVNPHFLFNTLNNIYSLAYLKSDKAAPTILMLSDMMRYILYECNDEYVPLENEINYLKNYIELQQLKKSDRQDISLEIEGDPGKILIAPLLFLPLFENAFKHGNPDDIGKGWIKSVFRIKENKVMFSISNTYVKREVIFKKNEGGIGLENIRARLKLIYPGKYTFDLFSDNAIFVVNLEILT